MGGGAGTGNFVAIEKSPGLRQTWSSTFPNKSHRSYPGRIPAGRPQIALSDGLCFLSVLAEHFMLPFANNLRFKAHSDSAVFQVRRPKITT
jgi:hypothetical protein